MKRFKLLFLSLTILLITIFNVPIRAVNFNSPLNVSMPPLNDFQKSWYEKIMWNLNSDSNVKYIAIYTEKTKTLYISNNFVFSHTNFQISSSSGGGFIWYYYPKAYSYYKVTSDTKTFHTSSSGYDIGRIVEYYDGGSANSDTLNKYLLPSIVMANSTDTILSGNSHLGSVNLPKVDKWHFISKPDSDPNKAPLPTIDPSKPTEPRPTIAPTPPPSLVGGSDSSNTIINNLDISVRPYIKFIGANGGYLTGGRVDDVEITPEKYLNNRTECQKDSNGNYTCMTLNQDWIIKWPNFPRQNIVLNAMYEVGFDFNFNKYVSGTLEFDFSCGGVNGSIHYSIPLKDVTSYKFVFENSIDGKLLNTDSTDDTVQNNYPNIKNMTITNLLASDGLIVQDNQLNNTIENGNAQSNSSNDKLQGSNNDLDNVITDYDKYDKQFNDDLTSSLKNIDFNKFKLDGSGLKNSSAFIRTHFNKISSDNGNPLGLVLGFSMLVGLAVLFIGKKL